MVDFGEAGYHDIKLQLVEVMDQKAEWTANGHKLVDGSTVSTGGAIGNYEWPCPRCPWTLLSKTAGCPGGCNRQCCTLIECSYWETWETDEAAANDARCTALRLQLTVESDGNSDWNREICPSINYGKNNTNTSCAE
jgi:hypothetical protein